MSAIVELHEFLVPTKRVFILDVVGVTTYVHGPYIILSKVYKGSKVVGFDLIHPDERKIVAYRNVKKDKLIPESWLCPNLVKINSPRSVESPAGREKPSKE